MISNRNYQGIILLIVSDLVKIIGEHRLSNAYTTIINWVHQYESELNNPYESKRVMDVFIPIVEGFPSVGDEAPTGGSFTL
ncbi:hypothetical protein [Bacillus pseudomycoides]|uniref:hypothetical protein n=1 Tax=Bacillus pseudomycoides TaxID=64104 RepID=UPI00211D6F24|nr:hypothetical protein [Bacillus pseudomycoides]